MKWLSLIRLKKGGACCTPPAYGPVILYRGKFSHGPNFAVFVDRLAAAKNKNHKNFNVVPAH